MKRKGKGNGIIVLLVIVILIMAIFIGLILSGIIKVNNTVAKNETKFQEKTDNTDDEETKDDSSNQGKEDGQTDNNGNITSQKSSVSKEQILSYYKERINMESDNLYSVADINDDNIPELFIFRTGFLGNEIIAYTSVFTYDENVGNESNNYIIGVGSINGRLDSNTVLYKMKDGRLLSVYGHMGYECTEYYTLDRDWLVRNSLSCRATNDYVSGDEQLEFKKFKDTSLIDNYK